MKIDCIWAMPNKWTFIIKPIKDLLIQELSDLPIIVDPFAGKNSPAHIKNDLNPEIDCEYHLDALDFLNQLKTDSVDCVLFDPPYSVFGKKLLDVSVTSMQYWSSVKDEMKRILKHKGKAICFGLSSMGLGKNRGFEMNRILLVPHGGSKNYTIVTVETKL